MDDANLARRAHGAGSEPIFGVAPFKPPGIGAWWPQRGQVMVLWSCKDFMATARPLKLVLDAGGLQDFIRRVA